MRDTRWQHGVGMLGCQLAFLLLLGSAAQATVTGLVQIPTAATAGNGAYVIEPSYSTGMDSDTGSGSTLGTEFGLGNRAEMGIDFTNNDDMPFISSAHVVLDAKYRIVNGENNAGLACGLYNIAEDTDPIAYLVGTVNRHGYAWSLGIQYEDNSWMWFAGVSHLLSQKLEMDVDYISGDEYALGIGPTYTLSPHYSLSLAALIPNEHDNHVGYQLSISFSSFFHTTPTTRKHPSTSHPAGSSGFSDGAESLHCR